MEKKVYHAIVLGFDSAELASEKALNQ